ncbi:MAG: hydantoin racemase [Sphingomonadales bacterium]|nr:hydantoin racemase [Sphingomonadales bacterium]
MESRRRIVYQLVAPMEKTLGIAEMERRRDYLQRHAAPRTEIKVQSVPSGYPSIESERDAVMVAPHLVSGLQKAEEDGASAGIVGCFSDPALDAVRETVRMPVVGPGQSSVVLALQLGERYSILSPLDSGAKRAIPRLRAQGLAERLASVRGVSVSVVDLARGANDAWDRIVAAGRRCVDEDGADVLVMGCMSMAFMGVERELSQRLSAPVVSPVLAALKTAETLLDLGLAHSRAAWPSPPDKTYVA